LWFTLGALGIVFVWFMIGSIVGPYSGKLSQAQKNDNASFLPASAESTIVNDLQAGFSDVASVPILIVFSSETPLTPAQYAQIAAYGNTISSLPLSESPLTVGDYIVAGPIVPIPSSDGKAALLSVNLDTTKSSKVTPGGEQPLKLTVEALRETAPKAVPGVTIHVTGPGGLLADLISVFGSIDSTLLLVTVLVVALILIIVYRSPVLWLLPLLSAGFALSLASAIVYALAINDIVKLNGQSQGILTVLVFGAATDYALLLVARYREELHEHESQFTAMRASLRGVLEPILASGGTVIVALLLLLFSELNSNKSTGPVAAFGIIAALLTSLTFLPALLTVPSVALPLLPPIASFAVWFAVKGVANLFSSTTVNVPAGPFFAVGGLISLIMIIGLIVFGILRVRRPDVGPFNVNRFPSARWAFWPQTPRFDHADNRLSGTWSRIAGGVGKKSRLVWILTTVLLGIMALGLFQLDANGISQSDSFTKKTDSVKGQTVLAEHFPAGSGSPAVIITPETDWLQVAAVVKADPGVASVVPYTGLPAQDPTHSPAPKVVDGNVLLDATLKDAADSAAAQETIKRLRVSVKEVNPEAKVGGFTAINYDTQQASQRDRRVIIPLVLVAIFLILALLLRALLIPLILIGTVILSYVATLGASAFVFHNIFGFKGEDSSFPLFTFVFLVALGIDYNIFLMTRVREETFGIGTRPGILKGLTVTGGVITSAGIVLAATFSVLGVLPLVFLAEVGFAVAFGVLLDTFIVRSLLVPALTYDIGHPIWWPSRLAKSDVDAAAVTAGELVAVGASGSADDSGGESLEPAR
jgi:RND superfamily putative drug exporter